MSIAISADVIDSQITVWSKRAALVLVGWFLHSATVGTLNLHQDQKTLQHVQTVVVPKLKEAAKCEDKRADKTASVAGQAILSNRVDAVATPDFKAIPSDNCPHILAVK